MKILILGLVFLFSSLFAFSQKSEVLEGKFLIVLDVQEYYNDKLPESSVQKLLISVNDVISQFDPKQVVYVKSNHKVLNLSLSSPFIYVSYDSAAMHFDKRLNLVNDQVFTKIDYSVFSVDALNQFLKQKEAKEIVIVGLLAEECIYKSLISGQENGYQMYTIPEAILAKSDKSKTKVLKKLVQKGIRFLDFQLEN